MGCFYLCEVKINLKTDAPDGIELGKRNYEEKSIINHCCCFIICNDNLVILHCC